jgi:hypothetical protein
MNELQTPSEVLQRLLGVRGKAPLDAIAGVAPPSTAIEDWTPLGQCLE